MRCWRGWRSSRRSMGIRLRIAEVGQLMRMLVRAKQPKHLIEVGTNIGYSVVVLGRECAADAVLETIELDRDILATRETVRRRGAAAVQVVPSGAALEVLADARRAVRLRLHRLREDRIRAVSRSADAEAEAGAMIVCDNLLWGGKVAEDVHDCVDRRAARTSTSASPPIRASPRRSSRSATASASRSFAEN
jgi:predicted O-methyltransferase YrrM